MANRPSRLVVSIPTASADGRFYGRYPHGDAPFTGLAGTPADASQAHGALRTNITARAAATDLAVATAALTTKVKLSGAAVAAASAAAVLTARTRFAGGALAASTISAVLTATPPATRRYANGHMVAFSDSQTWSGSGSALHKDSGTTTLTVGDGSGTLTIDYSNATIPGGHLGNKQGYSRVFGAGQTGPFVVNASSVPITKACTSPYYWSALEPTQGNYNWTRLDADVATCAALGVMLFIKLVTKTFDATYTPAGVLISQGTNPLPPYMVSVTYPYSSSIGGHPSGGYGSMRWNKTLYKNRFLALAQALGARYNNCPSFGGVSTQETSIGGTPTDGDWSQANFLTGVINETIALRDNLTKARQIGFTNFGLAFADIKTYWAALVDAGGWCGGPDLVLVAGGLHANVYPNYALVQNGTSPIATVGRTLCSCQRAEWLNIAPADPSNTFLVQDVYNYGTGNAVPGAVSPNYFDLSGLIWDFHTANDATAGQKYSPQCRDLQIANPTFGYGAPVR